MKSGLLIASALLINLSSFPPAHADEINAQEIMRHKDVGVAIVTVTDKGTSADDHIKCEVIERAGNESHLFTATAQAKP